MFRVFWSCFACLVVCFWSGCSSSTGSTASQSGSTSAGRHLDIVCTTGMVADIVQQVAGSRATVTALFGSVDPHTYEPTAKDVERILAADVVFYSGLLLEGPTQKTLERAAARGRQVFAVTTSLEAETDYIRYPGGIKSHPDPHVWMDVSAWSRCVANVEQVLSRIDPVGAADYQSQAATYRQELEQLDAYARESIASIPQAQRQLVTAHDAFEYFSRAYSIPVRSVQGISTESEAGTDDINRLVDFLVTQQVPAVFVESTVNQANLRAVIEGAARKGWSVSVAGELYSDAMGPTGTYEGTYLGMLDHNVTRITRALGGTAPERGLRGRLGE
ncbi:MAG: metal ABC transporter solute-binding protein, Zn/Mn family [Planctomycetaceae bacterium]